MPEQRFDTDGKMFTATKRATIIVKEIYGNSKLFLYAKDDSTMQEVLKKAKDEFDKDSDLKYGEDYVFEKVEDI